MSKRMLVISDLHLADGNPILDGFGQRQQTAFEGLLRATEPGGSLEPPRDAGEQEELELILNGDVFDLLAIPPYLADGISTAAIACKKLAAIVSHHRPFFAALQRFLRIPGRRITFIPGNHDIELVFPETQEFIQRAVDAGPQSTSLSFSKARYYHPLPDVYVEHGHQYDFWNHARDAWDETGQPRVPQPDRLTLPVGTQYFQRAAHPISKRFPYFDSLDPSIDSMRQFALLCLLDPTIVIETAQRAMQMLSYPRTALKGFVAGDELQAATFFEKAMRDFAAFQQDMLAQDTAWQGIEASLSAQMAEQSDPRIEAMREFSALREMLCLPPLEATRAILSPVPYAMGESVAAGMLNVLRSNSSLRYAIAGHTHMLRHDILSDNAQVYLNTASWTKREALPTTDEITPELLAWLRDPSRHASPLHETTRFIFALADSNEGQPSIARLYQWTGAINEYYQMS